MHIFSIFLVFEFALELLKKKDKFTLVGEGN